MPVTMSSPFLFKDIYEKASDITKVDSPKNKKSIVSENQAKYQVLNTKY